MTFLRALGPVTGVVLLSSACVGNIFPTPTPTPKVEIVIATELPVSGDDGVDGTPAQNGVRFAVDLAGPINGIPLTLRTFDDAVNGAHDPLKGAQNIAAVVADQQVLGVIGPLHSTVARAEIPIASKAGLVMIGPGATDECLTQPLFYCTDPAPSVLRPTGTNSYFRMVAADTFQPTAMADFAIADLAVKRVAIWTDGQPSGRTLADRLAAELGRKGGSVVLRQDLDPTTPDWTPFLRDAKAKGAQAIYAATKDPKACKARGQMAGILDVPYLIGSGALGARCFSDAGAAAANVYATIAATPEALDVDKAVLRTFTERFPRKEDLGPYTFPAYDAARLLINAIARAMGTGSIPPRSQVLSSVAQTSGFRGAVGTYTFDQNGDPAAPAVTILRSTGREWVYLSRIPAGG